MTTDTITQPNVFSRWFSRVVWLGILFNLVFVATEIFAPNLVNVNFGVPVTAVTVWNIAHAAMVLGLTLLYMPAAIAPLRFPAYSWMFVISRFLAVVLWASLMPSTPGFVQCLIADGTFAVAEAILLQLALPQESRIGLQSIGQRIAALWHWLAGCLVLTPVRLGIAIMVLLAAVVGYILWDNLLRAWPDTNY